MPTRLLGGRLEASRRTLVLALGDAAMIALFVALGELRHAGTVAGGVETFVQFALGWILAAVVAGVYAADALSTPRRALVHGVATWVVAALVGQAIRVLATPRFLQPSFVLVSLAVGALFVGGWRYLAARTLG